MRSRWHPRQLLALFFSRLMRTGIARRWVAPFFPRFDAWLWHRTGRRFQLSSLLTPVLILHTTGARTGLARETPLVCWPRPDGSWLVSGSNWGKEHHPAWSSNLLAHPHAEIVYRGREIAVTAALLAGPDRDAAWPVLESQLPEYREYERQSGRQVRIFRLVAR
jgi:deazaflavin-dependent oxidoreductase (nitroreductase family)